MKKKLREIMGRAGRRAAPITQGSLPDDTMHLDGKPVRLVERNLITRWSPIGKNGALVPISYVVSKVAPA